MASFLEETAAAQDGVGGEYGKMQGQGDRGGYDDVENVHAGSNDEKYAGIHAAVSEAGHGYNARADEAAHGAATK